MMSHAFRPEVAEISQRQSTELRVVGCTEIDLVVLSDYAGNVHFDYLQTNYLRSLHVDYAIIVFNNVALSTIVIRARF